MNEFIILQAIGACATLLFIARYLFNNIKYILRVSSAASSLFCLQLFLMGNVVGAILSSISCIRSFLFSFELKPIYRKVLMIVMITIGLSAGVFKSENALELFVSFTVVLVMTAEFKRCEKLYRKMSFLSNSIWMYYCFQIEAYWLLASCTFIVISSFIAMLRFDYPFVLTHLKSALQIAYPQHRYVTFPSFTMLFVMIV